MTVRVPKLFPKKFSWCLWKEHTDRVSLWMVLYRSDGQATGRLLISLDQLPLSWPGHLLPVISDNTGLSQDTNYNRASSTTDNNRNIDIAKMLSTPLCALRVLLIRFTGKSQSHYHHHESMTLSKIYRLPRGGQAASWLTNTSPSTQPLHLMGHNQRALPLDACKAPWA